MIELRRVCLLAWTVMNNTAAALAVAQLNTIAPTAAMLIDRPPTNILTAPSPSNSLTNLPTIKLNLKTTSSNLQAIMPSEYIQPTTIH